MKKKVLFMIDSLTCGGAERSLVSLLPCLDFNQIDVDLLLVGRGGIFEKYVPKEVKIQYFDHGCVSLPQRLKLLIGRLKFSFSLRINRFRKEPMNPPHMEWITCGRAYQSCNKEYDVAIAYQQGFPCYYIMEKVKAKRKLAWINVDIFNTRHRPSFIKPYYDKYDKVITVSEAMYTKFIEKGLIAKDKLTCVYDIINVNFIRQQSLDPLPYQFDASTLTIVTVARLIERNKGQDMVIKAAKILKSQGYSFNWLLVGDGPDRESLEMQIIEHDVKDVVTLTGLQANPYPFIRKADVYVQTSRYEGFGLTITEAKILAKPIVSTNFPSAYDQIVDGENGLIVEMNPIDIANGIIKIINDKDLANKMIAKNAAFIDMTAKTESEKVMNLILGH